jgi:hypothetical protein
VDSGTLVVTCTDATAPSGPLQSTLTGVFGCVVTAMLLQVVSGSLSTVTWMVTMAPEKNSRPRQLKITGRLFAMLTGLPNIKMHEYLFHNPKVDLINSLDNFRTHFQKQRRKAAVSFQNPRIIQITFKTLRHWKASVEYHKTKDILHVMQMLGHKISKIHLCIHIWSNSIARMTGSARSRSRKPKYSS